MKQLQNKIAPHTVLAAVLSVVLLSAVGVILAAAMGAGGMALDSIFVLFVAAAMAANLLVWPMIFQKYENKNTRAQVLGAQCAQARHAHSDPAAGKTDPIPEHWVPLEDVRNLPEAEPITGLEHLLENFPFAPLRGDLFERPQHMRHGLQ